MEEELNIYHDDVKKCVRCGVCQASCPTYRVSGDETMVARGRMSLVQALLEERIDITRNFAEKMSSCTSCMSCVESCPNSVNVAHIIHAVRFECYRSGKKHAVFSRILDAIFTKGWPIAYTAQYIHFLSRYLYPLLPSTGIAAKVVPFINNNTKRTIPVFTGRSLSSLIPEIVKPDARPQARVLFFLGCMTDMVYQNAGIAAIQMLRKNNIEIVIPRNLYCCGAPLYYLGNKDSSAAIAEKNISIINSLDVDAVITPCATCGTMLTREYDFLSNSRGIGRPVMDIHKFLVENRTVFEYDQDNVKKTVKVTYHDPCHLKRGQGESNSPRTILQSIPWVDFIEMKDADQCCGGSGMFSLKNYALALEIAKQKIINIQETGADIVATGCPSCQMHISDALQRKGLKTKVVHTVQLCT